MNHRVIEITARRSARVVMTLCALSLSGSSALAAKPDWSRRYNAGVTAYQSNDFAQAAAGFENATASADRALQQRALYNLGNTNYRLGQAQQAQAQQSWQRAIKDYESALALDPQDADAKFNHDFVKKKLEELKKQQQEQQQKQNQENQQDKKQEQNKDEQKQQQQNQDQQQQDSKDKQSEQDKQQQSQRSQEQQKQDQEEKDKQQEHQTQQEKPPQPEQKPVEKGTQPENYEKMQAAALLNDLRENERNWNYFPEVQMKDLKNSSEPAKDW